MPVAPKQRVKEEERRLRRLEYFQKNKALFDQLIAHRTAIEEAFGGPLSWERLDAKRACRIRFTHEAGGYRSPEDQWPALQDTVIRAMDRLEKALRNHLRQLRLN